MSILTDGYPSIEEIKNATGWPDEERFARGPVAVIECVQKIPCNPCEAACPAHAITVGSPITNTPVLDREEMYWLWLMRISLFRARYFYCG